MLSPSPQDATALEQELTQFHSELADVWADHTAGAATADEVAARKQFEADLGAFTSVMDEQLLPVSRANDAEGSVHVEQEQFDPAFDKLSADLTALHELETDDAADAAAAAEATYESPRTTVLVVIALALVAAVTVGLVVARSVSRPLAAVEAQTATTHEMSRNVAEAPVAPPTSPPTSAAWRPSLPPPPWASRRASRRRTTWPGCPVSCSSSSPASALAAGTRTGVLTGDGRPVCEPSPVTPTPGHEPSGADR